MTLGEFIQEMTNQNVSLESELVIVTRTDADELQAFEPVVLGYNGWNNVAEVELGTLISG